MPQLPKHQHSLLAREAYFTMSSSGSSLTTLQSTSRHTTATMPLVARIIRHSLYDQAIAHTATSSDLVISMTIS
jgi:hypothetical protein